MSKQIRILLWYSFQEFHRFFFSGAEGWEDIEDFGHLKLDWLKQYGTFNAGIPKHDTIARVICRLKADEIENAFQSWISSLIKTTGCDVIAIDKKWLAKAYRWSGLKSIIKVHAQVHDKSTGKDTAEIRDIFWTLKGRKEKVSAKNIFYYWLKLTVLYSSLG